MPHVKVDDQKVMQIYNTSGSKVARDFMSNECNIKYPYCVLKRLKNKPVNGYDKIKDKFLCTDGSPFLGLDELCTTSKNASDIPHKNIVDKSKTGYEWIPNIEFSRMLQELAMEKLLEMTKYISLNHATSQCRINKNALDSAGYQVEIY